MVDKSNYHMSTADFRQHGHALIDWIANYLDTVEEKPVSSQVEPGAIRALIPDHPPEEPEKFASIMADLDRVVMPGITHWQSPNWFAYFPANSSPPAILGELAAAGLAVQGMFWTGWSTYWGCRSPGK
jgi:aromatic-L-amino-acid decarboxylase